MSDVGPFGTKSQQYDVTPDVATPVEGPLVGQITGGHMINLSTRSKAFSRQVTHFIGIADGLSKTRQRDGSLALERLLSRVEFPLLQMGLMMAVDDTAPETIGMVLKLRVKADKQNKRSTLFDWLLFRSKQRKLEDKILQDLQIQCVFAIIEEVNPNLLHTILVTIAGPYFDPSCNLRRIFEEFANRSLMTGESEDLEII